MPELPEVETVRRGLVPAMEGRRFEKVILRRPNLRFDFPDKFAQRLEGRRLTRLGRRGKYLIGEVDSGERMILHLGMSGRFTIFHKGGAAAPGYFVHDTGLVEKHDHVEFHMSGGARVVFNDPRRFGFMDLLSEGEDRHLSAMGPEPLSNEFSGPVLHQALKGRKAPLKSLLLDQKVVAGLGNIYICEALYEAGLSPGRAGARVSGPKAEELAGHIKQVLIRAIDAGGSSLRDHKSVDGELGYFQHSFKVYGREGQPCHNPECESLIKRRVQSGRSSFYCPSCQQ